MTRIKGLPFKKIKMLCFEKDLSFSKGRVILFAHENCANNKSKLVKNLSAFKITYFLTIFYFLK